MRVDNVVLPRGKKPPDAIDAFDVIDRSIHGKGVNRKPFIGQATEQSTAGLANCFHLMTAFAHASHLLEYAMLLSAKAGSGFRMNDEQGPGWGRRHARRSLPSPNTKKGWALMFMLSPLPG
ncbi:hypothetical protein G6F68_017808 [Rhizopus microsporus]|nr:hypothetical protein G6F68_017808 [Rhizopus microsporus]